MLQGDAPNGTCTGNPFAFPVLTEESSRHTPDQPDGEKQALGTVLSSAWTCLYSMPVMTVMFLGLFEGQEKKKKKMHRYLINSETARLSFIV